MEEAVGQGTENSERPGGRAAPARGVPLLQEKGWQTACEGWPWGWSLSYDPSEPGAGHEGTADPGPAVSAARLCSAQN